MKTKDLKNSVLEELQLISDLAMEDVKNDGLELGYIEERLKSCKTPKKLAEEKDEIIGLLYRHSYWDKTKENMYEIDFDGQTFAFPLNIVNSVQYSIKNNWPEGKEPTHKNWTKRVLDSNANELQKKVMEWREDYNIEIETFESVKKYYSWLDDSSIENKVIELNNNSLAAKERVKREYKKSKPGDLIRLCWKFITDSRELEGVHFAWVDPKVTFEPYEVETAA